MKTMVLSNRKGGVGKSFIVVQLAFFMSQLLKKRVLVIDFDHQQNTSKTIKLSKLATTSAISSSELLKTRTEQIENEGFILIPGDQELMKMEKQGDKHNEFATNLQIFIKSMDPHFDVCLIDTNPNPDIRQLASLVVSDFVLSPIQLNQEAIDGIGDLLNHESIGIRKIKATINKKLELIGILPNIIEPTPFQRENFRDLSAAFAKLLIPMGKGFAGIKKSTAIPEAQAAGIPLWSLKKTSARSAWKYIKPVFETIALKMGIK